MKKHILISLAIGGAALVAATAAFAAGNTMTSTATITGTAGVSLNIPATASLASTLSGADQTVSYSPVLGVIDARGSGAGWNLTVSATNFSDGAGHTLLPGNVTAVSQACTAGSSCTAASSSGITYPLTISSTAAKLFNAATNSGMGKVDLTPTIQVAVPGNAYAGTYTSTLTFAAATGP